MTVLGDPVGNTLGVPLTQYLHGGCRPRRPWGFGLQSALGISSAYTVSTQGSVHPDQPRPETQVTTPVLLSKHPALQTVTSGVCVSRLYNGAWGKQAGSVRGVSEARQALGAALVSR